jgi:hypothetical protein
LLDYFAREKRNSSQFADFEKLLNSNFSAIQNSKIHGFKDCILSQLGVFSELSTVINLTLQAQNLSCQLSVLDKSDKLIKVICQLWIWQLQLSRIKLSLVNSISPMHAASNWVATILSKFKSWVECIHYMHAASNWVSTILSRIESLVECVYDMHAASNWVSTILWKFKSWVECIYYMHAASNWVSTILSNPFNLQHTALLTSDWKN